MTNILQTVVTVFSNVTAKTGIDMPLELFLNNDSISEKVLAVRSAQTKEAASALKRELPCATISARCPEGRKEPAPFEHTGLLCIDVDGKDNPHFPDGLSLKAAVCAVAEVAYCSLSASGNGCFALFRISKPELHTGYFTALERLFQLRLNIQIDRQCGDIRRLRFASFDPAPYVNEQAPALIVYDETPAAVRPRMTLSPTLPTQLAPGATNSAEAVRDSPRERASDYDRVGRYVREIVRRNVNIANDYSDWIKIGMALTALGEEGRQFFHDVSSVSSKYSRAEADAKFTSLLSSTTRVGLGTFFRECYRHDIIMPTTA